MLDQGFNLRKVIVRGVIALLVLFAFIWLYSFLTTASVTVTTSDPSSYVKISGVLGQKNGKFSKQAPHKVQARVKGGKYQISVYNRYGTNGSSRTITVKARQKLSFSLNAGKVVNPEPVYGSNVSSVVADGSQLFFVDSQSADLEKIDSTNHLTTLFPSTSFNGVEWASPGLGVAQAGGGQLYAITNGSLDQLQLPFALTPGQKISYDISKDGTIYIAFNGGIYSGRDGGSFSKIFSTSESSAVVAAGTNGVAVLGKAAAAQADEGGSTNKQPDGSLTVWNGSSKVTKNIPGANNIAWSPGGKYLMVTGRSDPMLFNNSLSTSSDLYISGATSYTWGADDATIFYSLTGSGNQLWEYDLGIRHSHEVSALALGQNVTDIYPSLDKSYAYFTAQNSDGTQLFRAALKDQPAKNIGNLNIFLPEKVGVCSLNYINFLKPVILAGYPAIGGSADSCTVAAKKELQYYNIDPNKFQYQAVPIAPSD